MKSVIYEKYGSPENLKLVEREKPVLNENQVMIKVKAVAINSADHRYLTADPFMLRFSAGLFRPKLKTLGSDISGKVIEVGAAVKKFKVGDRVLGSLADNGFGGLSEYICVNEDLITTFDDHISFEVAAATPMPSITALQALRDKAQIKSGHKVAINGASGGVGSAAVQLAKHFGAHVTAVCSSRNIGNAVEMGADSTIDYGVQDFTTVASAYDIVLGVNGYHPIEDYMRTLSEGGTYVMIGGTGKQLIEALMKGPKLSKKGTKTLTSLSSKNNKSDLEIVTKLLNQGILTPAVNKVFPVEKTVDAFKYYTDGKATGKVVIVF